MKEKIVEVHEDEKMFYVVGELIRCKDCKHQEVEWHEDRRRKDGGYMIYWCNLCEDPFVPHGVCGEPEGYCSLAEKKGKRIDHH